MKGSLTWQGRPKLWNRGQARAALMGREPTMNPSAAASSILGMKVARATLYNQGQARRRMKRRTRTHNPVPAALSLLSGGGVLGKLGKLLGGSPRVFNDSPGGGPLQSTVNDLLLRASRGEAAALRTMQQARAGRQGAAWNRIWAEMLPQVTPPAVARYIQQNLDPLFAALPAGGAGPSSTLNPQLLAAGTTAATALGKTLIQSATRTTRGRGGRVRQVTRYDPATGDKYRVPSNSTEAASWPSRKPSQRQLAGLGGAAAAAPVVSKAAGLAGAGAGAVAGVVIGGLAVGVLIGTALRRFFGTAKAVRAEEAAVQGALALRETRAQLEAQLGRKLNATETRALFAEYTAQLRALGFQQDAQGMWHRPRSAIERLLG